MPIVLEWVPKIYEYLYNQNQPFPVSSVAITIADNLPDKNVTLGSIALSADYLSQLDTSDSSLIVPFLVDALRNPNLT